MRKTVKSFSFGLVMSCSLVLHRTVGEAWVVMAVCQSLYPLCVSGVTMGIRMRLNNCYVQALNVFVKTDDSKEQRDRFGCTFKISSMDRKPDIHEGRNP